MAAAAAAAAAVAGPIAAYLYLAPPCSCNVQGKTKPFRRVNHNPRAVDGHRGAQRERHGAGARHAQARGDGEAAALSVGFSDVAAKSVTRRKR